MADADVGVPPISGDDLTLRLFVNSARFGEDLIVSADFKPHTVKYRDAHLGNKVLKVDIRLFGWDASLKFHYKTDKLLQAALAQYNAKMTPGSAPVNIGLFFAAQQRDSAALKPGYLLAPIVFDFSLGLPGLTERLTQACECWGEKFNPMVVSG